MRNISVVNDIVPVGEFKARLAKYLKEIKEKGSPLVITQNGKPAGVLLSPFDFDELRHTRLFVESVARGLRDSEKGEVFSTSQVKSRLKRNRSGFLREK